jgi:hypothetical protein
MSTRTTTWVETEYHDTDLSTEVKRILLDGFTGQVVLNCKRGRIMSVVQREKSVRGTSENNSVDTASLITASSQT